MQGLRIHILYMQCKRPMMNAKTSTTVLVMGGIKNYSNSWATQIDAVCYKNCKECGQHNKGKLYI